VTRRSRLHGTARVAVRYAKDPQVDKSLRHSVRDAVAFSVMSGAGETYFSAFALFLKASTPQIALLASLPPLLGSFMQLLSAWIARYKVRRKTIILLGAGFQALTWVPLLLLPVLFPEHAVPLLIVCVTVYYATAHLIAPQWTSLMGDLVPERRRGRYFARRTRLASVTAFFSLVLAGAALAFFDGRGHTLAGYGIIFTAAAAARVVSAYHLGRMREPATTVAIAAPLFTAGWLRRLRRSPFIYFSLFMAIMQFAVAIASPFFTVYMLRDLHYSYLQFTANTATVVLVQFLTLNTWGRLSDVFGNRLILVLTGAVIPFLPALWLVSSDFWYLIGVQILGGLCWAGFNLSAGNFLYDLVPSPKRTTYLAFHNVVLSIGVFLGAILGGLLAAVIPPVFAVAGHSVTLLSTLQAVFLISTLVRLITALAFLPKLREVRAVRPMSVRGLVFRVTRFNALSGLIFDVVTLFRRNHQSGEAFSPGGPAARAQGPQPADDSVIHSTEAREERSMVT
jgi:MFS family permease